MPVKRRNTLKRRNYSKKKPLRKRSTKKNSLKRKKNLSGGGYPSLPRWEYTASTQPTNANISTPTPIQLPEPIVKYDFPAPSRYEQLENRLHGAEYAETGGVQYEPTEPEMSFPPPRESKGQRTTYGKARGHKSDGPNQTPPPEMSYNDKSFFQQLGKEFYEFITDKKFSISGETEFKPKPNEGYLESLGRAFVQGTDAARNRKYRRRRYHDRKLIELLFGEQPCPEITPDMTTEEKFDARLCHKERRKT